MADATSKKLWLLMRPEHPSEVRCAAAQVLGQIGNRDATAEALCDYLDDSDSSFRLHILVAIGKLRVEKALPSLLARVNEGGLEAEAAARAAAQLGARGAHALQKLMPEVAPGLRLRIASALAAGDSASAETAAVDVLLNADPHVIDASARSLAAKVPTLSVGHRRALADHVIGLLGAKKRSTLSVASEVALLRLLGALGDSRAESIFWLRTEPSFPADLRTAALQALGTRPLTPSKDKVKRLLACAVDADFRLAAPAMMMLKTAPITDRDLPDWLSLFDAPDVAARRFVIEKLGDRDHRDVASALLHQLYHPDRALREDALGRLAKLKNGRESLTNKLLAAENPDQAWTLSRAQIGLMQDHAPELRRKILDKACAYIEDGDRRADAFLFLLKESDPNTLRDQLEKRALALRKKKKYAAALIYLRLLARNPACGETTRLELAGCGLKVSDHSLATESRAADLALPQFAGLLARRQVDLFEIVEKTKWFDLEDLFYLGFHFAEGNRQEKELGARLLNLVVCRSPKSKIARDAKRKLRSEGID